MVFVTGELRRKYNVTWQEMNDILKFMEECGYLKFDEESSSWWQDAIYKVKPWPKLRLNG
jgi:hypothetical protein